MEALINKIKEVGKAHTLTVNNPIMLDEADKLWFVEQGNISLYTLIQSEAEYSTEGKRFYFASIEQHQIMLGFNSKNSATNISILADAMEESIVYEMQLADFESFNKEVDLQDAVVNLVDDWLENIFFGISENANHPNKPADVLIQEGERLILRQGDSIASQKQVVWAKIAAAKLDSILINGREKVESNEVEVLIPLTKRSFLESTRNVGIRFVNTKEALAGESGWLGLKITDEVVLNLEKAEIELTVRQEKKRLQQKYENQFQKANQSLFQAQSILKPKILDKYGENLQIETENALFNACQVVAGYQNIRLNPFFSENSFDPLGDIIRASKIRYREVVLEGEWYKKDSGALLGFLQESDEPIALMPLTSEEYEAYNPDTKETFKLDNQTVNKIDKVAYTFYKPFPEKKLKVWDLVQLGVFKDVKDFYWLIGMGIGGTILGLLTPILMGVLFDEVIPQAAYIEVLYVGLALLVALMGIILFEMTENFALLRIETKMDFRLQSAVWDRLLALPVTFFRQFNTGDLADRAMGINEIHRILSGVVITSVLGSIFSLLNFFLLFYYSIKLALVALLLVAIQVAFIYILGRWQIARQKEAMFYQGKTQGIVLQMLNGITKFRVTGTEIRAFTHWLNQFTKLKKHSFRAGQVQNTQNVLNVMLPLLFNAVIYWMMMQTAEFNTITTGKFLAFFAAYNTFTASILAMSNALLTVYQIFPIYERTRPILETLPEADTQKANPGKLKGNIEVSQLNFRYDKDSPLVLQDVSFKLNPGDYVALVGPSGSGKSTLVRLLLGFDKPDSGSIFYDDQELSQLDIRLLRRQIGTVLQDGQLTPGDIFSNIVGSSPQLTLDDAWEAAKLAAFDEDIKQMPMGMHTVISEGASTLSGGQKQRLLIAQVLVHKPRILIFDEATSALDNRTQAIVTNSLNKLQATRLVIAHRLSTIQNVDKIIVFDKGKIVQMGTYHELINQEGLFKELAHRQME